MKKLLPNPTAKKSAVDKVLKASRGSKPHLNVKYDIKTKASSKTSLLRGTK